MKHCSVCGAELYMVEHKRGLCGQCYNMKPSDTVVVRNLSDNYTKSLTMTGSTGRPLYLATSWDYNQINREYRRK